MKVAESVPAEPIIWRLGLGLGLEVAEPVASPPCFCRRRLLRLRGNRGFDAGLGIPVGGGAAKKEGRSSGKRKKRREKRSVGI